MTIEQTAVADLLQNQPSASNGDGTLIDNLSPQEELTLATGNSPYLTIAELIEQDPQHDWVVEGLLCAGGTSILSGRPKKGKSTLVRQLMADILCERPFLGRETKTGNILYFALEESPAGLCEHFLQLGISSSEPRMQMRLATHDSFEGELFADITRMKPTLVVIDTFARFFTRVRDFNEYGKVNPVMDRISRLASETGAHILLVTHAGKSKSAAGTDDPLGSTAFTGGVQTVISLTEEAGRRTISSQQRYGRPFESTQLAFHADTRSFSLGQTSREQSAIVKEERDAWLADMIVDFIEQAPGATEPEIMAGVRGAKQNKQQALKRLLRVFDVRREGEGVSGDPYRHYVVDDIPVESDHF